MALYHKIRKILEGRGLSSDYVVSQFIIIDDEGREEISTWNTAALGPVPTQEEIENSDDEFIIQKEKVKNELTDPIEYMLALYLARKGNSVLLEELDAKLDGLFEENPKIKVKDLI